MVQINGRSIFAILLFLFTSVILLYTIGMRNDIAMVPRVVGFMLLVLSGIELVYSLFPRARNKLAFLDKTNHSLFDENAVGSPDENVEETESKETVRTTYRFAAWILVFVALIYFTNMILAILISFFIYLKWISKESWKLNILYSLIMAIVSYLVFVKGFGIHRMWF